MTKDEGNGADGRFSSALEQSEGGIDVNVRHLINRAVKEYPEHLALVYRDHRRTFRELNERVNRLANGILGLGIKKGDRVGMLLRNCCEFIEIDFALSKTGIVRVPLNARLTGSDHEYMLNDSGANVLIFGEGFTEVVETIRPNLKTVRHWICVSEGYSKKSALQALDYEELLQKSSPTEPEGEVTEEDLHTLFYTSGTTGKPKGAMLTQKSWANVAINLVLDYGPMSEEDVILNTQPLSHGAGFFVLPYFMRGGTNVLIPEFKPSVVFETIEKEKVTVLKLVPSMLYQLLEAPEKTRYNLTHASFDHLRRIADRGAQADRSGQVFRQETGPALRTGRSPDVHLNVIEKGSYHRRTRRGGQEAQFRRKTLP